ncbi:MAG: hypothetical protein ACRDZX_04900 [Acidimicrobiales bacterium]
MPKCPLLTPPDGSRSFRVELPDGRAYWTVVDDAYLRVEVADRFLFDLRFGLDRSEGTTRVYAGELARFLGWCARTGRSLEEGATHLSSFVLALRTTPTSRPGRGQGRPPGPGRINHVLAVAREFYKHAVAAGSIEDVPRAVEFGQRSSSVSMPYDAG